MPKKNNKRLKFIDDECVVETTDDEYSSGTETIVVPPTPRGRRPIYPSQYISDSGSESGYDSGMGAEGSGRITPPLPPPEFKDHGNKPSRSWFYTLNNYTEKDVSQLEQLDCVYHIFGKETGANGTEHLQGCITFKNATRLSALKKINVRIHWEVPRALEAARNYCTKDQDCFLKDNRKQGQRTDLRLACELLKEGKLVADVAESYPTVYVKYVNGLTNYASLQVKHRGGAPQVNWFYGKTGTGKTATAIAACKDQTPWISDGGFDFFNGYENQESVIFDDFRGEIKHLPHMLRLLDRYPMTVNVKYGHKIWNPKVIYITTPYAPADSFSGHQDEDMEQLLRRISNIVEFLPLTDSNYEPGHPLHYTHRIIKGMLQV